MTEATYQCPECGLHYESKETAEQCAQYCKEHKACNRDIAKQSVEVRSRNNISHDNDA